MTETAVAPDNAALHAQEQLSCLPSCCAKLELGSLFCSHCIQRPRNDHEQTQNFQEACRAVGGAEP
jgi:hypothetical protein